MAATDGRRVIPAAQQHRHDGPRCQLAAMSHNNQQNVLLRTHYAAGYLKPQALASHAELHALSSRIWQSWGLVIRCMGLPGGSILMQGYASSPLRACQQLQQHQTSSCMYAANASQYECPSYPSGFSCGPPSDKAEQRLVPEYAWERTCQPAAGVKGASLREGSASGASQHGLTGQYRSCRS